MKRLEIPISEVIEMYDSGMGRGEIAEKYRCSDGAIKNLLIRNGVKIRHRNNFKRPILNKPSHDDIVYLAGIIDGEGSICFEKSPFARDNTVVTVGYANNSIELMVWTVEKFGYWFDEKKSNIGTTAQYQWRVRRMRDVLQLLEWLEPYLIVKKEIALKAIPYLKRRLQMKDGD